MTGKERTTKMMGTKDTPHGISGKGKPLRKKVPLPQLLRVFCPNYIKGTPKSVTPNIIKTRHVSPSEYPA